MLQPYNRGFSLIELAIVMFIVSLILGGLLTPLSTRLEAQNRKQTNTMLAEIKESLIGYAIINGHLPCPDCSDTTSGSCGDSGITSYGLNGGINDGIEDGVDFSDAGTTPRSGNNFKSCAVQEGNLPWATLGVPEDDAWENRFHYRVTDRTTGSNPDSFADDEEDCSTSTSGISFCLDSTGDININDEDGNPVAQNVPAIVISFGANADDVGNPSSNSEKKNQDDDTTFVQEDYRAEGTNEFDDLLIWVSPDTLMYKMISAERLP